MNGEVSCGVGLRSIRVPGSIFKLYLCGGDGYAIFIQHDPRAIRRIRRLNSFGDEEGDRNQSGNEQASKPKAKLF